MKTISRRALFDDVWSRPLSTIAPEYGLSDVGLRKICDRADIPTPGRGYWAKVASGQTFPRPKFRAAKNPDHETVYIHGNPQTAPHIVETIERVRAVRSAKTKPDPGRQRAESHAAAEAAEPNAPEPDLSVPHRFAKATVAKLAASKSSALVRVSGRGLFTAVVTAAQADRVGHILTLLLTAVEEMGWSIENTDKGFRLSPDGEPLAFSIIEQTDKVRHEPTAVELAALAKHEANRKRAQQRGQWFSDWDRPKVPDWDDVPNGRLTLSLETGLYRSDRIRRNFADGKTQRLETMIDRIVESLAAYAASEKASRARDEQRRQEALEAELRREERARRQALEDKRVEFLNAQLKRLKRARELESFVGEIEKEGEAPAAVRALLNWAQEWASELRGALSHETLRAKIERVDLMNDEARIASWVKVDEEA